MNKTTTILLVNDDEKDSGEIKHLLRLSGYRVIVTDNGRDAAVAARFAQPELLLVNLCTPLLYKIVAARQIIMKARLGDVPIVLLAEDDDTQNYSNEYQFRRNEHVTPAADYGQIEELVNHLLAPPPKAA